MGAEASCVVTFNGRQTKGKARLETDVLHFRGGDVKLSIPFAAIGTVAARAGALTVKYDGGSATFHLGSASAKWAGKIKHPPSRLDKLGVKPEWRVSAVNIDDQTFLRELESAVGTLSIGRVLKQSDAIFVGATRLAELARLEAIKASLKPAGAIWIVRPKGRPEISEGDVMAAGKSAGLVDVKVVRFSDTHTAEKFVIPVAARPKA